jgi:hypothetical protein
VLFANGDREQKLVSSSVFAHPSGFSLINFA